MNYLDRVLAINNNNITFYTEDRLLHHIKNLSTVISEFTICSIVDGKPKRNIDEVGSTTGSENSQSEMRKNKPEKNHNKKPNRTSSVDSESRETEHEPLLIVSRMNNDGQPSPDAHGRECGVGFREFDQQAKSMPLVGSSSTVIYTRLTDETPECINSLPIIPENRRKTEVKPVKVSPQNSSVSLMPEVLLKFPHHVRWDYKTKTVELTRSQKGNFGFTFKVKAPKQDTNSMVCTNTMVHCINYH